MYSLHFVSVLLIASEVKFAACLADQCSAPVTDDPNCRGRIPTIYYDREKGRCDCFHYSGCGGTSNRFKALSECMISCSVSPIKQIDLTPCETLKRTSTTTHSPTPSRPATPNEGISFKPSETVASKSICDLPLAEGPCRAYIPRFFYNKKSQMCDCFIFSGCDGNANNFKTATDCMDVCNVPSNRQRVTPTCRKDFANTNLLQDLEKVIASGGSVEPQRSSPCEQPVRLGTGNAYLPSFYYNKEVGMCDCFVYSGRDGNENRFRDIYECMGTCGVHSSRQEISSSCVEYFEGTQILVDLLNDPRLRKNTQASLSHVPLAPVRTSQPSSFFPVLPRPVLPRPSEIFSKLNQEAADLFDAF